MDDEDDGGAAWHQLELEGRRFEEEQRALKADPAYEQWLRELNEQVNHEVSSESICRF